MGAVLVVADWGDFYGGDDWEAEFAGRKRDDEARRALMRPRSFDFR